MPGILRRALDTSRIAADGLASLPHFGSAAEMVYAHCLLIKPRRFPTTLNKSLMEDSKVYGRPAKGSKPQVPSPDEHILKAPQQLTIVRLVCSAIVLVVASPGVEESRQRHV